ncbi:hypothetical protein [Azohydromonas aeria]|uniref:hypothetical protein n=1 Tax=Azohydromonas aeria TaxID=2590212 RepID=UPI0012FC4CC2|nr:hypothetical protein [Azohydromonas aeria]
MEAVVGVSPIKLLSLQQLALCQFGVHKLSMTIAVINEDAVKLDYGLCEFSQRKVIAKHSVDDSTVSLKARTLGWTDNFTLTVKLVTKTALLEAAKRRAEEIDAEVGAESERETEGAIKAAVSENVAIVMGHRKWLADLATAVDEDKARLLEFGPQSIDVREAAVFVQAVGNPANATKVLIEQERKVHGLDDQTQQHSGYEDLLAAVLAA